MIASRRVFARDGANVSVGKIAKEASVSRATFYRNFATLDDLAATLMEDNVELVEQFASKEPDSMATLYHLLLDIALRDGLIAKMFAHSRSPRFKEYADRLDAAMTPALERAHDAGQVHAGVTVRDVMSTLPMAAAGKAENESAGRNDGDTRIHQIFHRALFTTTAP
ncbi:TetR family transcriptional regulator [Rhodococcus sp. WS1]|nr:helix-turn-helix domain-containing protein [Rhodococcus sp. WS7]ROZ52917.1 TetR family transcriptional regulator [Rhodococcus sp. WS1]TQC36009.1 TetR family transcriptional regulator [Rhodococcus sp. WS7]